jgi:hypothetical protein
LREVLAEHGPPPPFGELALSVADTAARAGLLVTGSVRRAVDALARDDASLASAELTTETGFAAAVNASRALRAILAFALGDAYLAARSRALRAA